MAAAYGHYVWIESEYEYRKSLCFICATKQAMEAGEGESIYFEADEFPDYECDICGECINDRVDI